MTPSDRLRTLILTRLYAHTASYYNSWQNALSQHPLFDAVVGDLHRMSPSTLARDINTFDAVVLLHSCTADTLEDLPQLAPILADRKSCRLIAFVGNEFNSPYAPMAAKIAALTACRPDVLATQLLLEAGLFLYDGVASRIVSLPHGLDEKQFKPGPEDSQRRTDLGFRGFRYSPLIGDQERNRLVESVEARAGSLGLIADIDWRQRLNSERWAAFLQQCRGTVGSEAGSWYLDRDDALVTRIYDAVTLERKGIVLSDDHPLRSTIRRLPGPAKKLIGSLLRLGFVKYAVYEDETLDFQKLESEFFNGAARAPVYSKCISSRNFEAAGTKTCQILTAGRYNDIFLPDRHYIAVNADLSDLDRALSRFNEPNERARIAGCAYTLVMEQHTFAKRAVQLHRLIAPA